MPGENWTSPVDGLYKGIGLTKANEILHEAPGLNGWRSREGYSRACLKGLGRT
jgi:hypothetical protein